MRNKKAQIQNLCELFSFQWLLQVCLWSISETQGMACEYSSNQNSVFWSGFLLKPFLLSTFPSAVDEKWHFKGSIKNGFYKYTFINLEMLFCLFAATWLGMMCSLPYWIMNHFLRWDQLLITLHFLPTPISYLFYFRKSNVLYLMQKYILTFAK